MKSQCDLTRILRARLFQNTGFEPVESSSDLQRFSDYDLASSAETCVGEVLVPEQLDDAAREAWRARAGAHDDLDPTNEAGRHCYWIRDEAGRVGSIAFSISTFKYSGSTVHVSSVYTLPAHRRSGHASRALMALRDYAFEQGVATMRLDTTWCSAPAVRLYLSLGMWIRNWKRDLVFTFERDLPGYRIERDADRAQFCIGEVGDALIGAERRGDQLVWRELPALEASCWAPFRWRASYTFAVALASHGFPLLRSEGAWQQQLSRGFSDAGEPEGLAFKIRIFEAWHRKNGWRVDAPRIPGLEYPSWSELTDG